MSDIKNLDLKASLISRPASVPPEHPQRDESWLSFKLTDGSIQYGDWVEPDATLEDTMDMVMRCARAILRPHVTEEYNKWKEIDD